ncbi:MAG: ECF transporter S component [Oscillospiraceae bacterium]
MQNKSKLRSALTWIFMLACLPVAIYFSRFTGERQFYISAFICIILSLVAVFISYENQKPDLRQMSLLAVLSAVAIAGRIGFAAVPFIKPLGAIVIITGAVLGAQAGFLCGAVSCLISNFMFGQGPWTVWQMVAFGLMGALSGLIFYGREKILNRWALSIFGFVSYILITGPILDLSGMLLFPGFGTASSLLLAGLPINAVSGASTFVFLLILAQPIINKLQRIIKKYGINSGN